MRDADVSKCLEAMYAKSHTIKPTQNLTFRLSPHLNDNVAPLLEYRGWGVSQSKRCAFITAWRRCLWLLRYKGLHDAEVGSFQGHS